MSTIHEVPDMRRSKAYIKRLCIIYRIFNFSMDPYQL